MSNICFRTIFLTIVLFSGISHATTLTIGVGRDFYDGADSRAFLHGSTGTWESLTYIDRNMRAVPWLAESWKNSEDGRTWTFHIRSGVRFHDGTPMSNADTEASVRRIMANPKYDPTGNYRVVESVTAKGNSELVFQLKEPVPDFPKLVAYYASPVIKPSSFQADGRITDFAATGPYKIDKIFPGDHIELSAFDGYWGEKPAYRKVIFKMISDAQTRMMALSTGEIDVIADVGAVLPEQVQSLKGNPDIVLKQVQVATTHVLLFNCRSLPFSNIDTRLWFAGVLNRSQLVEVFAKGAGIEAKEPYTPLSTDFAFGTIQPKPKPLPKISQGTTVVILLSNATLQRWPYLNMAQVIEEMLRSYGFSPKIEIREMGDYHEAVKKGNFNIAIQPYTLMTGDPDFFYAYWIASDAPRNCGWKDAEVDILIRKARYEMNFEARRKLYRQLEEKINQHLPLLPLYHDVSLYAFRKQIRDFEMDHFFKPCLIRKRFPF